MCHSQLALASGRGIFAMHNKSFLTFVFFKDPRTVRFTDWG